MKTTATILLDSTVNGVRVTTFEVCFPRIIIAETNTHRVFSRSYQSSRALPPARQREMASFTPEIWRLDNPGMQPKNVADEITSGKAELVWNMARKSAMLFSEELAGLGIAKEICNRVVEPYVMCRGVITSTRWDNFYNLRCHPDAQYEFQVLAKAMQAEMAASVPITREIHLPYITDIAEYASWDLETLLKKIKLSVARCARVSYKSFDGNETKWEQDLALYQKLVVSKPVHASPAEHQAMTPSLGHKLVGAMAMSHDLSLGTNVLYSSAPVGSESLPCNGNFHFGVVQYRKLIEEVFYN